MKHSFLLCVLSVFCIYASAEPVDQKKATDAANSYFSSAQSSLRSGQSKTNLQLSTTFYRESGLRSSQLPAIYVFTNPSGKGFVILSAETSCAPVLGYSEDGTFDENDIAPQVAGILERWVNTISNIEILSEEERQENQQQWNELFNNDFSHLISNANGDIGPLIKTQWGQGKYYNNLCPKISNKTPMCDPVAFDNYAPVGCVAVAMAQVMKYWEYPQYGTGKIDDYQIYTIGIPRGHLNADFGAENYDWKNMPIKLSDKSTPEEIYAVAILCKHAAIAAKSKYGVPDDPVNKCYTYETTANLNDACTALVTIFNYSDSAHYYPNINLNSTETKNSIITDLNKKQPVIMCGDPGGGIGHAFICDGLKNDATRGGILFHLNLGWDGNNGLGSNENNKGKNNDGFYNLENEFKFNKNMGYISNLKPPTEGIIVSNNYPKIGEKIKVSIRANQVWGLVITDEKDNKIPNLNKEDYVFEQNISGDPNQFIFTFNKEKKYVLHLMNTKNQDIDKKTVNVGCLGSSQTLNNNVNTYACGQSAPTGWFDHNNDGSLDLFDSSSGAMYENVFGTLERKNDSNFQLPSAYDGSFKVFDYNNDSYLDIVLTENKYINNNQYVEDVVIYKNLEGKGFEKQDFNLPHLGGGSIIPCDFNNDGLIDLLVYGTDYYDPNSNGTKLYVLINRGDSFETMFEFDNSYSFRSENTVVCDDFNNDGLIDFVIRTSNSKCILFLNRKTYFEPVEFSLSGSDMTFSSGDLDGDGMSELIAISDINPNLTWKGSINIGHYNQDHFEFETITIDSIFGYNRSGVVDFNCDGKLDFYVTRTDDYTKQVGFNLFLNNTDTYEYISDIGTDYNGPDVDCGDFNNDGYPDVAISNAVLTNAGGNNEFTFNTPPTVPQNLKSQYNPNTHSVTLSWDRASDEQTPSLGLSYNIFVGTSPDSVNIVSPMSDITTGKRKITGMGNVYQNTRYELNGLEPNKQYYWSVQAIDPGHEGGKFAPVQNFTTIENTIFVTGIALDKDNLMLDVNQAEQLTAILTPGNANNTHVTWSSANPTIVTVSDSGWVNAINPGETIISATSESGNKTATCKVVVNSQSSDATLNSLSINEGNLLPACKPYITSYLVNLEKPATSITITAIPNNAKASISGDGIRPLHYGENMIDITVTAQDNTQKTYTITINNYLLEFEVVDGVLIAYHGWGGEVEIPDDLGIVAIGDDAFVGYNTLFAIQIPEGVTSIGNWAFYYCSNLMSITIPNSVKSIGSQSFMGCSNLGEIYCNNSTPPSVGYYSFSGVNQASCLLYVPTGTQCAYAATWVWENFNIVDSFFSITPSAGSEGSIWPNSVQTVTCGSNITFVATPNSGKQVDQWILNGSVVQTGGTTYTTSNVLSDATLQVKFKDIPTAYFTITATAGSGGVILPSGEIIVNQSSNQTFTFTPNANYEIDEVKVDGVANSIAKTNGYYAFSNVTANHTLSVSFIQKPQYAISAFSNPSAGGMISGDGAYFSGTSCSICATTNGGYTFTNWIENGTVVSLSSCYTFTVSADRNLVANFTPNTYAIILDRQNGTGGSSSVTATYDSVMPTATAPTRTGYTFGGYYTGTDGIGTQYYNASMESVRNWNIASNTTLYAQWILNSVTTFVVSTSSNPSEGGSTNGDGTYSSGSSCTVTATANRGYTFYNWTENSSVVSTNASYQFAVSADRSLVANFAKIKSNDATLGSLTVSSGTLMPAFNPNTTNYTVIVSSDVSSIMIGATANNSAATVSGIGTKLLNIGNNTFDIVVIAEDGTSKTYTVTVTYAIDTGINKIQSTEIIIYPNPVKNELFIKTGLQIKKIEINDLIGHNVKILNATPSQNGVQTISVSYLLKGTYLIKIYTDNGITVSKIVKE